MNEVSRERLLRAMGEVAVLSPADPMRQSRESEVAGVGGWAEEVWLDLMHEDERLRLDLRRVAVPEGLEDRLVAIAENSDRGPSPVVRRGLAVAAALAIVLLAGSVLLGPMRRNSERSGRLQMVALLAITDHLNDRHLAVQTSDPGTFNAVLSQALGFSVKLASPGAHFELLGGRRCTLGPHPVAYSLWQGGSSGQVSLFQARAADFGLPSSFPPTRVAPKAPAGRGLSSAVSVWAEEGRLYLLVADSAAALPKSH